MSTTKTDKSQLVQSGSNGDIQWVPVLYLSPISLYAHELWESLSEKDTAITYKQAIVKTWKLLKYLLALLFFVFLFGVALIISFWGIGFNLGAQFQTWLENGGNGRQPEELFQEILKVLFFPIQKTVEWANNYVSKYIPGWESREK